MKHAARRSPATRRLAPYRARRDFARTEEPRGEVRPTEGGRAFVVQKHAARALHYDFRLELDGVLLSWAVPKGPSLSPKDKRLAVRTEDHPLAYRDFEGIIPAGEYGGGAVIVWDRGTWEPLGDPHTGLDAGRLELILHGEKLHGRYVLVRLGKTALGNAPSSWLLIKGRDEFARDDDEAAVAERLPQSVLTQRSVEDVQAGAPAPDQRRAAKKARQAAR